MSEGDGRHTSGKGEEGGGRDGREGREDSNVIRDAAQQQLHSTPSVLRRDPRGDLSEPSNVENTWTWPIEGSNSAHIHGNSPVNKWYELANFGGEYFKWDGPIFGISAEGLVQFLSEDSTKARNDFKIIDLRNLDEDSIKDPDRPQDDPRPPPQIKDAEHFPLYQGLKTVVAEGKTQLSFYDLAQKGDDVLPVWTQLRDENPSTVANWATMRYLFFHCMAGVNRTPFAAVGYYKSIARSLPDPPKLVIVEGGFDAFSVAAGPESPLIEPWKS